MPLENDLGSGTDFDMSAALDSMSEGLGFEADSGDDGAGAGTGDDVNLNITETDLAAVFSGLRQLRDRLMSSTGLPLPELSMGMSGDFEIAITEGATIVRIGSAIFGHR